MKLENFAGRIMGLVKHYEQDESDKFINKIMSMVVVVLAFLQLLSPLVTSFLCLIGIEVDMPNVMILIMVTFIIVEILNFSFNLMFFKWQKPSLLKMITCGAMLWFVVTTIINGAFNYHFIVYFLYIAMFAMFLKVDKKYYKAMIFAFVIQMVVCSVFGLVDPYNKFTPGFVEGVYAPMSMQFTHPNYSAYVLVFAIFAALYAVINYKKVYEQIIFWTSLVVLGFALFVNGSYGAEFAMFCGLVFMILFFWNKNKKCPWQTISVFGIMFVSIFTSQLYPGLRELSIAKSNFILESLSAFDSIFGTSLLKTSTGGAIDFIPGSDGWGRAELLSEALKACVASPKTFFFGYGAGYNNIMLVHNVYIRLWLEMGVFGMLAYIAIIVLCVIMFVKKFRTNNEILGLTSFMAFVLIIHNLGSLESYSFIFFIMLFAMLLKTHKEKTQPVAEEERVSEDVVEEIKVIEEETKTTKPRRKNIKK